MKNWPIEKLKTRATPYYFYDMQRLEEDCSAASNAATPRSKECLASLETVWEKAMVATIKNPNVNFITLFFFTDYLL